MRKTEGALSLVDYYVRRMPDVPNSIEPAKAAMQQAISDLQARVETPPAS